ncbi:DUF7079 family protein [Pseudomonas sp. GCEP-101]|uniref:DUF7079 family protein n=1 Tax=Pseudomonas sp. GCEP-101 TaxID=2974552 RepID=UPI00223B0591|nr:hypothetical protein [Pseudomonas sp. GCEP-101]
MADQLNRSALWVALSDLFADSETNYRYIAEIAKNYTLAEVEFELFERVAPVCIGNMFSPVPPIWGGFSEKELVKDIEEYILKRSAQGVISRGGSVLFGFFIRAYCAKMWAKLIKEIGDQTSGCA